MEAMREQKIGTHKYKHFSSFSTQATNRESFIKGSHQMDVVMEGGEVKESLKQGNHFGGEDVNMMFSLTGASQDECLGGNR